MGKVLMAGRMRTAVAALTAAALALMMALALAPQQALANREISAPTREDGTTLTVADDITRIHVDKVDAGTHEFVVGAHMQILVQATGEVVDEWYTDGTTHKFEKGLDVNVPYVLREVEAPEGYSRVGDTVFIVNEMEGTGITIVSKDPETELSEYFKVTLYDHHDDIVNDVVRTEDRQVPGTTTTAPGAKGGAPQTGDTRMGTVLTAVAAVAGGALVIALIALVVHRKRSK